MSDAQCCNPGFLCQGKPEKARIEWTTKYGDTLYELYVNKWWIVVVRFVGCFAHPAHRYLSMKSPPKTSRT